MKLTLYAIITLLLIVVQTNYSQTKTTPRTISFQGVLMDSSNHPYPNNKYQFVFRFYDSENGGNLLWESSAESLQTESGLFNTQLGKNPPFNTLLKFDTQYWLSLQVNGMQMPKRIELTSVGRSVSSGYADSSKYSVRSDTARFAFTSIPQTYVDSSRISGTVPNNSITTDKIINRTIRTEDVDTNFKSPDAKIADTVRHSPPTSLSEGSVTSSHIQNGTITSDDIADTTIKTSNIKNASIIKDKIANSSITKEKIADNEVTRNKIEDNSINESKLEHESVTSDKIRDSNVTSSKIGRNAVNSININDNAIETRHLSATIKIPNADSISHIGVSKTAEANSLFPLNAYGDFELQTNPTLGKKTNYISLFSSWIKPTGKFVNLSKTIADAGLSYAVEGIADFVTGIGVHGDGRKVGVFAESENGNAVEAFSDNGNGIVATSPTGYAAKFIGKVDISDAVTMGSTLSLTGAFSGNLINAYKLNTTGRVGIGVEASNVNADLHVRNTSQSDDGNANIMLESRGGSLRGKQWNLVSKNNSDSAFTIYEVSANRDRFTILRGGSIGIGGALSVGGNLIVGGFTLPSSAPSGYVLTKDEFGNGTWKQASGGSGISGSGSLSYIPKFSGSTSLSNSLLYDDGTNIGIGTTSPSARFHVSNNTSTNGILGETSTGYGVRGYSSSSGYGVSGYSSSAYGGYFETGSSSSFALVARSYNGIASNPAFYATGNAIIDGNLTLSNGSISVTYTGGGAVNVVNSTTNGTYAAISGKSTSSGPGVRAENTGGGYALRVEGTSFFTGAKTGYVADICKRDDNTLEEGDIVEVSGVSDSFVSDMIPMMKVKKCHESNCTKIVGIVDGSNGFSNDTLLVVTLGAYRKIKVDASYGSIQVGDLLTSSNTPGYAMKATEPRLGAIIGKALEPLTSGTGNIKVFVSLK
ncbi:MAG: hypothetical protein KGZ58_02515 [Ignavibacteriales bacterium]|nr:hypothetical protein [Ignavibacteriales bacterium]